MKAGLVLIALLVAAPAAAEDCARYADALAFNACLARQGPAAGAVHVGSAPAAGVPRRTGARVVASGRRGRSEMVFSIKK
jgi:hypothetical protein